MELKALWVLSWKDKVSKRSTDLKADVLKSDIQDVLDSGEVIPKQSPNQNDSSSKGWSNL